MTSEAPFGIAVLGAGLIAQNAHLPAWAEQPRARVLWIVDVDAARAQSIATEFNVPHWTTSLDEALADTAVDAVDICLPPHLHLAAAEKCINAGKHVLVEKPIAATMEEAQGLVRLQEATELTVMIAENWLFSGTVSAVQSMLEDGSLGTPYLFRSHHESDQHLESGLQPAWTYNIETSGGGYLMQAGIHAIAMAHMMLGRIVSVSALSTEKDVNGGAVLDRDTVVSLEFESGAIGSLSVTAASRHQGERRLHQSIFTDRGIAEFDVLSGELTWTIGDATVNQLGPSSRGFVEELGHFVDCVETGEEPLTSPRRQIHALAVVLAAYRSLAERRAIEPSIFESAVSEASAS